MDTLIGVTLGQYQIIEEIGQGGMGRVFKAYQPGLDRHVAIKVLLPSPARETDFRERFQREARAIAALDHPNILPVYDFGQQDDYSYIAMRYVAGGTLKQVMDGELTLSRAVNLIEQLAAALETAHRRGIIHRDVKPANVLMDGDWALLGDFGLVKLMKPSADMTGSGLTVGTPAYMSPEQGQGQAVDHRTDIYALGVILFEMLTGQNPHQSDTPLGFILKRAAEPAPSPRQFNPQLSEAVEQVLLKALATKPEDRFDSAADLSRSLKAAVNENEAGFNQPLPETSPPRIHFIKSPEFPLQEPYYPLPEREEDIEKILKVLRNPRGRSAMMVTGLGGIGKTALAVEVVRRCVEDTTLPFRAILWESAKQELFVEGELMQVRDAAIAFPDLVDSLGCQIEGPNFTHQPAPEKEKALKRILFSEPYLVVIDNLETIVNTKETMLKLQRVLGQSRAIITSRQIVAGDTFHVLLNGLSEASALAFLRKEAELCNFQVLAEANEETLKFIYQTTEGMPLAMKLVASQAELLGLTETLNKLKEGQGNIYFFIFLESWKHLTDDAQKLLLYLGPTVSAVGREELELALEITGTALDQIITELVRLSLLTPPRSDQQGYSIHQLTRYFVVNDLPYYWKQQGLI